MEDGPLPWFPEGMSIQKLLFKAFDHPWQIQKLCKAPLLDLQTSWSVVKPHKTQSDPAGHIGICMSIFLIYISIYLSIYLPIYLPTYLSIYLSIYLSTYLPIYLSTYLSIYLSIYLPIYLSIYLSTYLPIYLSTYLPIYLSTYLPIYLSTYLSTYLPTYLSTYLPIYLSTYLSIYLSTYLPIYLSTYLSIYLSIYLPIYLSTYPSIYLPIHLSIYLSIYLSMEFVLFYSIIFSSFLFYSIYLSYNTVHVKLGQMLPHGTHHGSPHGICLLSRRMRGGASLNAPNAPCQRAVYTLHCKQKNISYMLKCKCMSNLWHCLINSSIHACLTVSLFDKFVWIMNLQCGKGRTCVIDAAWSPAVMCTLFRIKWRKKGNQLQHIEQNHHLP